MLLTQTRRFATAAFVQNRLCRPHHLSFPLAWRSTTFEWRKCLSLSDCMKNSVPLWNSSWASIARSLAEGASIACPRPGALLAAANSLSLRATSIHTRRWNKAERSTPECKTTSWGVPGSRRGASQAGNNWRRPSPARRRPLMTGLSADRFASRSWSDRFSSACLYAIQQITSRIRFDQYRLDRSGEYRFSAAAARNQA